jgi:hypothetical protein
MKVAERVENSFPDLDVRACPRFQRTFVLRIPVSLTCARLEDLIG